MKRVFQLIIFGLMLSAALTPVSAEPDRPNILVILCDDLGYGDLACFGHPFVRTPNLDRLARQGMRLTHCYSAAPVCSPARAGLMTGRSPQRVGVHNWIPMQSPMHLRRSEITVATLVKRHGYATGMFGKWHLNGGHDMTDQPQPNDHGFDHWFATQNNAHPNHRNPHNFYRNGEPVGELEGYASHLVADEAINWLRQKRDPAKPFFAYVAFHEPHEPIASDPQFTRHYPSDDPSLSAYFGNVTQVDAAVGKLMAALDEMDLTDNTFVFFTSDNGPALTRMHPHGSAGPLREKKGYIQEGGIRVPGILRWPGRITPGTESDQPVSGVDLLPTVCDMLNIQPPNDRVIDGASIQPMFVGELIHRKQPLYWQSNWTSDPIKIAMRIGEWKILARLTGPQIEGYYADLTQDMIDSIKHAKPVGFELYNVKGDSAELVNVAPYEPQRMEEMRAQLLEVHSQVQEETPTWGVWEWPRIDGKEIRYADYWLKRSQAARDARQRQNAPKSP